MYDKRVNHLSTVKQTGRGKPTGKRLRTLLALLLVLCYLSAGMTASALSQNAKNCRSACSGITVIFSDGTKSKVPLKKYPEDAKAATAGKTLKAKAKKGWKRKSMSFYNANTKTTQKQKNGGSVKLNCNADSRVIIKAKGKRKPRPTNYVCKYKL